MKSRKKNRKKIVGFTLIELLVVLGIIIMIILLTRVVFSNPRIKTRNLKRVSDVTTIQTALGLYYKDQGFYPTTLTPGLPLRSPDNQKTYLYEVPSNPQPRTDNSCPDSDYRYWVSNNNQSYSFSACVDDNKTGKNKLIFGTKEAVFHCGDRITDRDGFTYGTVSIGSQCWMAENLKTKTRPDGSCINEGASVQAAPSCLTIIGGISYGGFQNSNRDCIAVAANARGDETACQAIGAIYNWKGAMGFSDSALCANNYCATPLIEPFQGICPDGWHIPTDNEFTTLERTVCTSATCATDFFYTTPAATPPPYSLTDFIPVARGTNEALKLGQYPTSTILNGYTYGRRNDVNPYLDTFQHRVGSGYGYLLTASETGANTFIRRFINWGDLKISRDSGRKDRSVFLRCIKN